MTGSDDGTWTPVFPGQRPPFAPGNTLAALTHGAYSPRKVDPLAKQLVEDMLADPDAAYLAAPRFRTGLWAWARAEARVQLLTEYLDGFGDLDSKRDRAANDLLHRAETQAATQRARLGLDPLSAARLGRDVAAGAVDTARLFEHMHERDERRKRDALSNDDSQEDAS